MKTCGIGVAMHRWLLQKFSLGAGPKGQKPGAVYCHPRILLGKNVHTTPSLMHLCRRMLHPRYRTSNAWYWL